MLSAMKRGRIFLACICFVLMGTVIAFGISYVVTRTALAVSVVLALPIVILDFLVSLVVWSMFDRFT